MIYARKKRAFHIAEHARLIAKGKALLITAHRAPYLTKSALSGAFCFFAKTPTAEAVGETIVFYSGSVSDGHFAKYSLVI